MEIYEVKVGQFVSVETKEKYENVCFLNVGDMVTHYCTIDFSAFVATDIFSKEQFSILEKNDRGQILHSQHVELHKNYAMYFTDLDLSRLSWCELCGIKLAYLRMQLLETKPNKNPSNQKQNIIKKDSK